MSENLSNGAQTTLNGAMNNSQTTATLTSASGWPEAPFRALITGEGGNTDEIILVGTRSGTSLSNIIRAIEPIADGSQVIQAHSSGATITQVLTRVGLINQGLKSGTIGAKVYNSGTQSVSTGADRVITFNSEDWDTDGFHDTSTNTGRLTIPAGLTGKYLITAHLWGITSGSDAHFRVNGAALYDAIRFGPTAGEGFTWTTVLDLVAGDYIEVTLNPDSGSITVGHASARNAQCDFTIIKLDSGRVGSGIGVRAHYTGGNQTAGNGSATALLFDTDVYDTDGFHNVSSNTSRFTIPTGLSGLYIMGGGFYASANCDAQIRINGTTAIAFGRAAGGDSSIISYTVETAYRLNAGDYVELVAVGRGSSQTVYTDLAGASPHFWLNKLDTVSAPPAGATGTIGAVTLPGSNTSAGTGSYAALNIFDTEIFDTDGFHSTSSNKARFTIPAGLSGKYLLALHTYCSGASGQFIAIYKNGSVIAYDGPMSSADTMGDITLVMDALAGDYYEAYYGGSSTTWIAQGTWWSIIKLDSGKVGTGVGAKAYNSTTQSVPNATYTALTLDSERWDTDGFHSTSSNTSRMTIPTGLSGKYLVTASSQSAANGTGDRYITFFVNGINVGPQTWSVGSASTTEPQTTGILDLVAGDYVEAYVWQNSGGSLNYGDASNAYVQTAFSIMRLDSQPATTGTAATTITSRLYLDRLPLHATYGDDFEAASLDAKWTRVNVTSGEETYQNGGGSWLRAVYSTSGARCWYQTAPTGDFEIIVAQSLLADGDIMAGPFIVDSSGAGVGASMYTNGLGHYLWTLASYGYSSTINNIYLATAEFRNLHKHWISLKKVGTTYTTKYSFDGENWTYIGSTTSGITVAKIGFGRMYGTSTNQIYNIDRFNVI